MSRRYPWNLALVALFLAGAAAAAGRTAEAQEGLVSTQHRILLAGKPLAYIATAGRLPIIHNDTGKPHGYMFFVAYIVKRAPGEPVRPLTFLWNGGPGASSSQVHLLGFGPRRFKTADTYPETPPVGAGELEDNQETWLDFTDLVFVDPIGTGYSRPTKPEYGVEFYNLVGDAESVAEFIRVYRQRFDRLEAPIFLAGESYGTVRAQWVAEALERRRTTVAGVALISGFLRLDQKLPPAMQIALLVPRFAATAYYHKRLPADLQSSSLQAILDKANRWAREVYAPALERRESVNPLTPAEREAIITELARYAGVKRTLVDSQTLTLPGFTFTEHLLEDKGLDLGRYDGRMTASRDVSKIPWTTFIDPSLSRVMDVMQGTSPTMIRYFRSELQYKSDLVYRGPFGGAYPAPSSPNGDWMASSWARGQEPQGVPAYFPPPPGAGPSATVPLISPLRRAMELNPHLRILVMTGMYDHAAPGIGCDLVAYSVSLVDAKLRDRIRARCYPGGHMMYTDKGARQQLKRDMAELIASAWQPQNSQSGALP